jgi:hypothetical protein
MQDFGQIDAQVENRAMQTLFFHESTFDGKVCRISVANYLAFLSLRGPEIADEIARLRLVLAEPTPEHLERDLTYLLQARNWRFHNIACVAIACRGASTVLLCELWACIARGSWTSPQLAATAAFVDPGFPTKALMAVEDRATHYKSIVGLAALLTHRFKVTQLSEKARKNLAEASRLDRDNAGSIALAWHKNLHEAFGAA